MPYKTLIELEKLKEHFHEPMADVARKFGVCTTFFKRICRTYGIKRWPFRKLQSLEKKINGLRAVGTRQAEEKLEHLKVLLTHLQATGIAGAQGDGSSDEDDPSTPGRTKSISLVPEPPENQGAASSTAHAKLKKTEDRQRVSQSGDESDTLTDILGNLVSRKNSAGSSTSKQRQQKLEPHHAVQEEIAHLLAHFVKRSLFRHEIHTCSSENHTECLRRFNSIKGAAIFIFEIDAAGIPEFRYISDGCINVYGLRPEEVTDSGGTQCILNSIHEQDQKTFLATAEESRQQKIEWVWRGRIRLPKGADPSTQHINWTSGARYKQVCLRATPQQLPDGDFRWEGFMIDNGLLP